MNRIKLTTSQSLVKFLDNQYVRLDDREEKFVDGIWGIFGHGCVVGMGEALEAKGHGLNFYQGHNEQGMGHAAIGFAKQNRRLKIMGCLSSIGPGATNMITAAATATVNRIPVLFLAGDVFASRQPDPVLQQLEQQHDLTLSVNDCFKPVVKYWDRITRPEQIMSAAINALRVLTDPSETGAVCLSLCQDVQGESYDYPDFFFDKRVHEIKRVSVSQNSLNQAIEMIKVKKNPLIILGGGVRYSWAENTLLDFVDKFEIPFAETQAGKGIIASSHRLNLGGIGVTGTLAANKACKESDLILSLGTRMNDFVTASKSIYQNPNCDFISVNLNSFDAHKMNSLPLVGDVKLVLEQLDEKLTAINYETTFSQKTVLFKDEWKSELRRLYSTEVDEEARLSQTKAIEILNQELIPEDAIVVAASGSLPGDLERLWECGGFDTYNMEYGYSCMGYEVSGALGAKMAQPEREVFVFVGDGSYILLHSELFTSIQEKMKINVILFDNNGFHCIDNLQTSQGIPSFGCEFRYRNENSKRLDGDYLPVDFAKNAESYGCKAFSVTKASQLRQVFQEVMASEVSTLIDIKVGRKTMTGGYESWWRVGTPEVSNNEKTLAASRELKSKIKSLRDY